LFPGRRYNAIRHGIIHKFCVDATKERSLTASESAATPIRVIMAKTKFGIDNKLVIVVEKPN
jgi:hypothetical protein